MPKIKTHRGAAKRLGRTGTGKLRRAHAGKSHILTKKNRNRKNTLKKNTIVDPSNLKQVTKLIPYK